MITDTFLNLLVTLVRVLTALLPNPAAPDFAGMAHTLSPLWSGIGWANNYVPVAEAVTAITTITTFFVGFTVYRVALWVGTKAHIFGGSGDD